MLVKVSPARCRGTVAVPPSKSMAHRALLCAGLAGGVSHLRGIGSSQDMAATLSALEALGAHVTQQEGVCTVQGTGGFPTGLPDLLVDCRESGSTLRFLIPIFALGSQATRYIGHGRLMQRSQSVYESLFAQRRLTFVHTEGGLTVRGPLPSGRYELSGNVSSQFITGLLFALPLLPGDSEIRILPPFQSRGYVDLTLEMLKEFGVEASFSDPLTLRVPGGQHFCARDHQVEGDYSQAAFFAVLGAAQGGLTLTGLRPDSLQGDRVLLSLLRSCGAQLENKPEGLTLEASTLTGREIDVGDCPDLAPILAVLGWYASGETRLVNAARLRDKESDRIASMEAELRKLGAEVSSTPDSLTIRGCGGAPRFGPVRVDGHNDHRIVMSLAIAATLGSAPVLIEGAEAISKSYPEFFDDLRRVGGCVEVVHE